MNISIEIRKAELQRQLDRYAVTRKPADWPKETDIQQLNRDIQIDRLYQRIMERFGHQ